MATPEEFVQLEREIKKLQTQLVTLRTRVRDIVAEKNQIAISIRETSETLEKAEAEFEALMDENIVNLEIYQELRGKLWATSDKITDLRNKFLKLENRLKTINDEIPAVEAVLRIARERLGEWGVVLHIRRNGT